MDSLGMNIQGYNVDVCVDDWQENPREWGVSSTLVTAHKKYTFGSVKLTRDAWSIDDAFRQHLAEERLSLKDIVYHRVFMFDHSGIALSTSPFGCRFDSGQLGFIYEKRSDIRTEFGVKVISPKLRQHILDRLDSEVQLLEYWANGEVYCFSVADESCGGFYGSDHQKSGLIEAATEVIENMRCKKIQQHTYKLKQLIKSGVALQYRSTFNLELI